MKTWIEIEGHLHNLDMLVEVIPKGQQGTKGYKLKFCNGSWVEFHVVKPAADDPRKDVIKAFHELTAVATAIRCYLFDRTIQVTPGPYRQDEGDY